MCADKQKKGGSNKTLKLTRVAISVSRGTKVLKAAPAD